MIGILFFNFFFYIGTFEFYTETKIVVKFVYARFLSVYIIIPER